MSPRVSVVMPSYQHGDFIGDAVASVLAQTFSDLELIVVDDGSKDSSRTVISSIEDGRLRPVFLTENQGACEAMNIGIRRASGEFIAVCNSDDMWEPHKLCMQVQFLNEHPDVSAVFSDVRWLDQSGADIPSEDLPNFSSVFSQKNRSRFAWQRSLVERGNCLCHPSVLIRKSVYDSVGLYNNYLRQLPDYDMWLRVVQKFEIHVMAERLVRFRIHTGNTSTPNPVSQARTWAEHALIAKAFFGDLDAENFYSAFGASSLRNDRGENSELLLAEKVSYLLNYDGVFERIFKRLALEMAYDEVRKGKGQPLDALRFQLWSGDVNSGFGLKVEPQPNSGGRLPGLARGILSAVRRLNRARLKRRRARKYRL